MTLLEKLQAHRGGLIQIKSELYWYDGGGWDGNPGRICLVLDATVEYSAVEAGTLGGAGDRSANTAALLLIDGTPRWVWVVTKDIELLDGGDQ